MTDCSRTGIIGPSSIKIVISENNSMKKLMFILIVASQLAVTVPSHAFFDWLFSGGASRDAIDNSALGDLRAWWTGNPGYVFNPWWSGPSNPQGQGTAGQSYGPQAPYPQMPQPTITYSSPQAPQAGYAQPMQQQPQTMQPSYGGTPGVAQYQTTTPQAYQASPQYPMQYQAAPQSYQTVPQGYQAAPQMTQQPVTQGYPAMTGASQVPPQPNYGRE